MLPMGCISRRKSKRRSAKEKAGERRGHQGWQGPASAGLVLHNHKWKDAGNILMPVEVGSIPADPRDTWHNRQEGFGVKNFQILGPSQ